MRVRWTPRSRLDLNEAYRFIEADSAFSAGRLVGRIRNAVDGLSEFPSRGRPGIVPGTRELAIPGTPYKAVYRVHADEVEVLRIMHGARQWPPA